MKTLKCQRCGHEWEARVKVPRSCPRCKRYDWDKPLVRPPVGGRS